MVRIFLSSLLIAVVCWMVPPSVNAQGVTQVPPTTAPLILEETIDATAASEAAAQASAAAAIQERVPVKDDITETVSPKKDRLTALLDEHPPGDLNWSNFMQHTIRRAIDNGLPANIVVLIILFPIIASIIAASRHLIGLQGFGVYIPAVLSVAFVSTGITTGIVMFATVLLAATFFRNVFKRMHLQYLPRTALLLWGVSLTTLTLLLSTAIFGFTGFLTLNIFPLLIIMLLTENFMETQLMTGRAQTIQLTLETLFIAIVCSLIISNDVVQRTVLLRPELTFLLVAAFNLLIGKYTGLRLLEYIRFRSLLER